MCAGSIEISPNHVNPHQKIFTSMLIVHSSSPRSQLIQLLVELLLACRVHSLCLTRDPTRSTVRAAVGVSCYTIPEVNKFCPRLGFRGHLVFLKFLAALTTFELSSSHVISMRFHRIVL